MSELRELRHDCDPFDTPAMPDGVAEWTFRCECGAAWRVKDDGSAIRRSNTSARWSRRRLREIKAPMEVSR